MDLIIELVPKSSWYSNLRSELPKEDWDRIRRESYRKAEYKCEICGGVGPNHPVECHEIWHYDESENIQRLDGVISLCPDCRQVKHIGLAGIVGKKEQAIDHLAKVNGWPRELAEEHVQEAFAEWARRSTKKWTLDLSWLEKQGVAS